MDPAALRAYAAASQAFGGGAAQQLPQAAQTQAPAETFANLVMDAVSQTEQSVRSAETLTAQQATGQAEMVDVVTAIAAAEVQLETVISVRDSVIRAYQEILRMPI